MTATHALVQRRGAEHDRAEPAQGSTVDRGVQPRAAGVPLYLAAVQKKCDRCESGIDAPEEESPLQRDAEAGASVEAGGAMQTAAQGVSQAKGALPGSARIQAAFGRHDLSEVRAEVGGPAADASMRLGARAYTLGNRIGFRETPDLHLAAHEAAHVVQQRRGVQLKGGIGEEGDAYERQADAAADRVVEGRSAEDLLDAQPSPESSSSPEVRGARGATGMQAKCDCGTCARCAAEAAGATREDDEDALQFALVADAQRQMEPPAAVTPEPPVARGSDGGGADDADGGAPSAKPKVPAADADARAREGEPAGGGSGAGGSGGAAPGSGAAGGGAPGDPAGATSTAGNAGGGGEASGAAQPACAGGAEARCFREPSPPPDPEPESQPPNPAPAQVREETSAGDEEDLDAPDDCTAAQAAVAGGAAAASASAAGAAGAGSAAMASPAAAGSAGAASGAAGRSAGGAPATPAAASARGAGPDAEAGDSESAEAAASPLEAGIAAALSQRDAAVLSASTAASRMGAERDAVGSLRAGTRFADVPGEAPPEAQQRARAVARADQFFAATADRLDAALALAEGPVADALGASAEAAKAQIATSIDTQKAAISARIAQARRSARADAASANRAVMRQEAAFVADARRQTTEAVAALEKTHRDSMADVGTLETDTLASVNRIYADGRTDLSQLGVTIGGECTAIGERFATTYRGFRHCTENGFWDGDLSERRSMAQEEAARKTAKGYHDRMVEAAHKRAGEVSKAGRQSDRCSVIAAADSARDTLDTQLANLRAALETARDATIAQAGRTRTGLLGSIAQSLGATLRQLDAQEHDQRQAVDDTGYMQQLLQEQTAHASAAGVQQAVAGAVSTAREAFASAQAQCAAAQPPDAQAFDEALGAVDANIAAALDGLEGAARGGGEAGMGQLAEAAAQALAALDGITQSNDEAVQAIGAGFARGMRGIAGTDNFASQRTAFGTQTQQAMQAGSDALAQAVEGMRKGCADTTRAAGEALVKAHGDLEKNLRQSQQGIECQIVQEADEAASHEAPAWKMLVAILLVIVVIVIVIAVTVATAGGALAALGPLATVAAGAAIGAAVGAVTSGLLAIASNLWNNRDWTQGVGHAMLVGAVTGAIGGGIGAGVGLALKGAATAVQLGAAMLTAGGLDVATQFVMGGFSFDHFSWANLGVTLVVTLLTFGLAHQVAARAPTAPVTEEAGIGAVHEPGTAKPPGAPAVEEPSVGLPREPAPNAPSAAEPGAPPTAETPSARTGQPATPEEAATLRNTAAKPSEELTPAELLTEREVAARGNAEPVSDPPFTQQRELPNGHSMKETPDGSLVERCSPGCVIFDRNGNPVMRGGASADEGGFVEHPVGPEPEVVRGRVSGGAEPEARATPEPAAEPLPPRRGSTSEEIAEVAEEFGQTPNRRETETFDQAETEAHADRTGTRGEDDIHPRLSESTSGPERQRAAAEAAERGPHPDDFQTNEAEIGSTVAEEAPPGSPFDDLEFIAGDGEVLGRPPLSNETKATIEGSASRNAQGEFVDADGNVIQDPHYGHTYGHENRRILAAAQELRLTQAQVNEYVNSRPEFFQIEEGAVNISHANEMPGLEPFDHIVVDMEHFFGL